MNYSALIADDDRSDRRIISNILQREFHLPCIQVENGREAIYALQKISHTKITVVFLDLDMPVMGGIETLKQINHDYPDMPVIILTASDNIIDAIEVMQMDAYDFLTKPVDVEKLNYSIRRVLNLSSSLKRRTLSKTKYTRIYFHDLIGCNSGLAECVQMGKKAASCDFPVLIQGKTGTGKEAFSIAIHTEGNRSGKPFIAINCGAIPEKLVESTLFGHEKGAFTGAITKNPGKFREADGGTIFLDEIGELPLEAQVKILRILQEKEVESVGSSKSVPIDVRIISATNRDLMQEVKSRKFREDLYYRLNVLQITLPCLSQRKEDIPELIDHFIKKFCDQYKVRKRDLSDNIINTLLNQLWPGNVRELENFINRLMIMGDENIILEHSFNSRIEDENIVPIGRIANSVELLQEDGSFKPIQILEKEIIKQALRHYNNNMSRTARALGIAKSTLYAKLNSLTDYKFKNAQI